MYAQYVNSAYTVHNSKICPPKKSSMQTVSKNDKQIIILNLYDKQNMSEKCFLSQKAAT